MITSSRWLMKISQAHAEKWKIFMTRHKQQARRLGNDGKNWDCAMHVSFYVRKESKVSYINWWKISNCSLLHLQLQPLPFLPRSTLTAINIADKEYKLKQRIMQIIAIWQTTNYFDNFIKDSSIKSRLCPAPLSDSRVQWRLSFSFNTNCLISTFALEII